MISVSKETSITILANTFFSKVFAHFVLWAFDDWARRCIGHWRSDHFLHRLCFHNFYLWRAFSRFEIRNGGSSWFHLIDALLLVAPRPRMIMVVVIVSATLIILILIVVLLRPRILLPAWIKLIILTVDTRRPFLSWQYRIINGACCGLLFKERRLLHVERRRWIECSRFRGRRCLEIAIVVV